MRNPAEALAWAKGQYLARSRDWASLSQAFVRSAFDVGAYYPSAAAAWDGAEHKHSLADGDRAPRGVPFYWTGGPRGFGHVVLTVGNGLCWSTDVVRTGHVDLVSINDITHRWGQEPVGWAEDINRVQVRVVPTVTLAAVVAAADSKRSPTRRTAGDIASVLRVERALARRGYLDPAHVDGLYGTKAIAAMHRFQRDRGLPGRGLPTAESVAAVVKGWYRLD